jgi:hypothetical protein
MAGSIAASGKQELAVTAKTIWSSMCIDGHLGQGVYLKPKSCPGTVNVVTNKHVKVWYSLHIGHNAPAFKDLPIFNLWIAPS